MKVQPQFINEDYQKIEKYIYKSGKSYRVRVGKQSFNTNNKAVARKQKKFWVELRKTEPQIF